MGSEVVVMFRREKLTRCTRMAAYGLKGLSISARGEAERLARLRPVDGDAEDFDILQSCSLVRIAWRKTDAPERPWAGWIP